MLLQTEFDDVITLNNPNSLINTIKQHNIDVVLLDMNFQAGINTGNEGIYWLRQILSHDASISVIMITGIWRYSTRSKSSKKRSFRFYTKTMG